MLRTSTSAHFPMVYVSSTTAERVRWAQHTRPGAVHSAPQGFVEEIECTLPGQLGSGLVITGCSVVMESVISALIDIDGEGLLVFLQGFLVGRPARVDALIK